MSKQQALVVPFPVAGSPSLSVMLQSYSLADEFA
jgi:hypothetical protein